MSTQASSPTPHREEIIDLTAQATPSHRAASHGAASHGAASQGAVSQGAVSYGTAPASPSQQISPDRGAGSGAHAPEESRLLGGLTNAAAALALFLSEVGLTISLAALIFAGPLASGLPRASTSFLFGAGVVAIVVGWRSSFDVVMSGTQDTVAIVLLAISSTIALDAEASTPNADAALTVIVILGLSSLIAGLAMLMIGRLGLGDMVRYIPTTVVAAFAAGTGWLLIEGGLEVSLDRGIGTGDLAGLLTADQAKFWLPAVALGLAIVVVDRIPSLPPLAVSVTILASAVSFYVIAGGGSSFHAATWEEWLIGPFPDGARLTPISPTELTGAAWHDIATSSGTIVAAVMVAIAGLLLNVSAIEFIDRSRVELDHELHVAGFANVLIAPFGALAGFHLLGDTTLARRIGAVNRAIPIAVGFGFVLAAIFGGSAVGYLPRFVAAGVLISVGLGLLLPWLGSLRGSQERIDRLVGVVIVFTMVTVGVLEGIGVGVVAICALFIVRYSRIDPIRRQSSGADLHSMVDRDRAAREVLDAHGDRRAVFELHGYLFFGSMTGIAERITQQRDDDSSLDAVIIDVRQVTGVDSTAIQVLARLVDELQSQGTAVVWSGVPSSLTHVFAPLAGPSSAFADLDTALEATENAQLAEYRDAPSGRFPSIASELPRPSDALLAHFSRIRFSAGDLLMAQGDPSSSVYYILDGEVSVRRTDGKGRCRRLRHFGNGTFVGEIGFVVGSPRTADVVAETPIEALSLEMDDFDRIKQDEPLLAFELIELIVVVAAERLDSATDRFTRLLR